MWLYSVIIVNEIGDSVIYRDVIVASLNRKASYSNLYTMSNDSEERVESDCCNDNNGSRHGEIRKRGKNMYEEAIE